MTTHPPVSNDGRVSHGAQQGWSKEPLYIVWRGMLQRCYYLKHNKYHLYGGRGITVCSDWWEYPAFRRWASQSDYAKGLQIDRVNTDGNYEPENCCWTTSVGNNRNRRNNRMLTAFGTTKPVASWTDDHRCVVPYSVLWERLQDGWKPERALSEPQRRKNGYHMVTAFGEHKALTEWAADPRCVVSFKTLWKRMDGGWKPERAIVTPVRQSGDARGVGVQKGR